MMKFKGVMLGMFVLMAGCFLFSMPQQARAAEQETRQSVVSKQDEIGVGTIMLNDFQPDSMIMTASTASSNSTDGNGSVTADGLRLRKSPSKSATVIGLLFTGESVLINYTKSSQSKGWYYVKRVKTGTWGWVDKNYILAWD